MKSHFVNYAFTTALYSEKRNFLDTFTPFVLKALYECNCILKDQELRQIIIDKFDLEIPVNTIKSIVTGLSKSKLVRVNAKSRTEWEVCLNDKGKDEVTKYDESESNVNRRQQKLLKSIQGFFGESGHHLNTDEIQDITLSFVQKNLSRLSIFNLENSIDEEENGSLNEGYTLILTKFINLVQESEPELYQAFEELVKGSIIRDHISNKEEVQETRKFEPLIIYLDANILFSLLEFHHSSINIAAKQLFKLLKEDPQIQIKAFSITLEEMARLLKSFKYFQENYNPRIPVNTIFYYLKQQNFDNLTIDNLISNLDQSIAKLGVSVENLQLRQSEKLKGDDLELFRDVYSYKNQQNLSKPEDSRKEEEAIYLSALHDANIILAISRKRGRWVKSFERSRAVFLTSSFLMDHFCKQRYRLEERFPEVILDLTLTNILWLRNPNKEIGIHLHKLISVHSKRFMIDNNIWNRFVKTLKRLNTQGEISKEQFATVFSYNQLTIDYLTNIKVEDISPESILSLAQRIEQDIEIKGEQLDSKSKELSDKTQTLEQMESRNVELTKRLDKTEKMLQQIIFDKKREEFIDEKMEEYFYPLGKKFWGLLFSIVVALLFMYFAEIADDDTFKKLNIPACLFNLIKFLGFLYPIIFTTINFKLVPNILRFRFNNSALKREFEKKFAKDFEANTTTK